jgi:hypothetical protein
LFPQAELIILDPAASPEAAADDPMPALSRTLFLTIGF